MTDESRRLDTHSGKVRRSLIDPGVDDLVDEWAEDRDRVAGWQAERLEPDHRCVHCGREVVYRNQECPPCAEQSRREDAADEW